MYGCGQSVNEANQAIGKISSINIFCYEIYTYIWLGCFKFSFEQNIETFTVYFARIYVYQLPVSDYVYAYISRDFVYILNSMHTDDPMCPTDNLCRRYEKFKKKWKNGKKR